MASTVVILAVVGGIGGLVGVFVIIGFLVTLAKELEEEKAKEEEENKRKKAAEREREIAKMARELAAYYQKKKLETQVEAAAGVDLEAGLEKPTVERFIDQMLDEKPVRFSSQLLEILTLNYSAKLGQGGYGSVYKGHLHDGEPLAVKVLNNNGITDKRMEEQFMAEVNTIGRTYHRNLVRLYGFCFEANTKALVYEYMENGSLDNLLFDKKHEIEWDKLYEIAIGAARGLEYLHHFSQRRIIHYDIKPANVLLDSKFCPKIADFGLAKLCNRDTTNIMMSRVGGTPGYAAPEVWMPFPVSFKCDVYSFGVMLFEIVGRRRNFDVDLGESQEWFPKHVWEKFDKEELGVVWDKCGIEEKNRGKAKTMLTVALWCVQYLPEARPSMRDVVKILEGGAQAATPPNPFQHLISSANYVPSSCMVSSSYSTTDYDDEIQYETS